MALEECITRAVGFFNRRLDRAKEDHHVLNGEVTRRDGSVAVSLGGWHLLSVTHGELMAPPDDATFQAVLESKWHRALEIWEWRRQKHQPRRTPRHRGDRGGGGRPSGRRS